MRRSYLKKLNHSHSKSGKSMVQWRQNSLTNHSGGFFARRRQELCQMECCINTHGKNERSQLFVMRYNKLCVKRLVHSILVSRVLKHFLRR
jgi:hypothetical protein